MLGVSAVSERYERLARDFTGTVEAVPDDRWSSASPCEDWTARDVLRHVVDTQGMFLKFIGASVGDIPSVDDDPIGAWHAARATMQAALEDPAKAQAEWDGHFGRTSLEQGVDRFVCFDLIVHRWDLGQAAGLDVRLDGTDVDALMKAAEGFGDAMRGPGAFGPAVDPPAGADQQTQALAFLGRRSW